MAFGIKRQELEEWKRQVAGGRIAFLTHYWIHPRVPGITTVTKAGCADIGRLIEWGQAYGLKEAYIDFRADYPHFDLIGDKQKAILRKEGMWDQLRRFKLL
ncbi:hypothetical protein PP175_08265 [Aneurinibacillus sp. Ricciae_BoGa-3]|uniref:hypothetical protein n=1 Tax=Aneurinibacillus sp. Ricciae_BoGa-3 TaxID=3022697 RepID=UPI0023422073|nr:hypothetical protein [Aneurinibacillus sp. Ricciae_BoGa-3]WCK55898.1 hypothetical protein PP175_08265 [Aneurinibacillus sp. Ricciae_BoGa-3]